MTTISSTRIVFSSILCFIALLSSTSAMGALASTTSPAATSPTTTPPVSFKQAEATLAATLKQARLAKKGSYTIRSDHMDTGEPMYTNRLILEDSPYLLQHAHNPVNWYSWGEEAFAAAREQNKPIFLSVGYSTCHWCHVMEEESFDDQAVAEILNRYFISIKVDREQRPDLDEIYMMGVQLMTGRGGWPMSNFLTTDGKPFVGGTYYPKDQFISLLQRVHQVWIADKPSLISSADKVHEAIQAQLDSRGRAAVIGQQHIDRALQQMLEADDHRYGGRRGAPKFPNESSLLLMLQQLERNDLPLAENPHWLSLRLALDGMLRGGIYDQVGGGFHRYSTDERWLVPHFEKMLYNQAQLARLYTRAWKLSADLEFRRVAEETLDYVLLEMRSQQGAFYSATDADSEGEEGKYFVWGYPELEQELTAAQLRLLEKVYGVTEQGNFEGANLFHLPQPMSQLASDLNLSRDSLLDQLLVIKRALWDVRNRRIPPLRDDKVITEWNGMMITALAEAGYLLDRPDYVAAAVKAANFIWQHNRDQQGLLYRIHLNGSSSTQATLEDYSFYLEGLLALYDASANREWLNKAVELQQQMTDLFWEDEGGGFYISQASTEGPMIMRSQSASDGATASGNSVALVAMVSQSRRASTPALQQQIDQHIARFSSRINASPLSLSYMLTGVADRLEPNPGPVQYMSAGHVRVSVRLRKSGANNAALDELLSESMVELIVALDIEEGWHINANTITVPNLIPTDLTLPKGRVSTIRYPTALTKVVEFYDSPLKLYQGKIEIVAQLEAEMPAGWSETESKSRESIKPLEVLLSLQSCSDSLCLEPETLKILLRP